MSIDFGKINLATNKNDFHSLFKMHNILEASEFVSGTSTYSQIADLSSGDLGDFFFFFKLLQEFKKLV